jgi:protein-export membrane protein SecD
LTPLRRNTLYLALVLLAVCIGVVSGPSVSRRMALRQGGDLVGGGPVVLQMEQKPGGPAITQDVQQQVVSVLQSRVNALGVREALVQKRGVDQVLVELPQTPGASAEQLRRQVDLLIAPAALEFIWLKDCKAGVGAGAAGNPSGRYEYLGGNRVRDLVSRKMLTPDEIRTRVLYKDPARIVITGSQLRPGGARVDLAGGPRGGIETTLEFNDEATQRFAAFTRGHVGALLAIVLNGEITSAPRVSGEIPDGMARITQSNAKIQEAQELADLLNAGALPASLRRFRPSDVKASGAGSAILFGVEGGMVGVALCILLALVGYSRRRPTPAA